jgi:hypothetical protein
MSLRSQRSEPVYIQGDNDHYNDINTSINDADVYNYALRVVLLQHVISHKPVLSTLPSEAVPGQPASSTSNNNSKRDSSNNTTNGRPLSQVYSATSSSWSSSWSALSLSDVFRSSTSTSTSSSSSSPRYSERFIKVLEHRIESISRGVDKVHTDLLLRYTVGAFYGKFKDPKNARLIKETRKLEDLLMLFIATATDVLRKRCATGDNNEWKWRLEIQLEAFVDILEACLRHKDVKHVPPELLSKLDTLKSKISANRPSVASTSSQLPPPGSSTSDNTSFDASTNARSSIDMSGSSTMSPVNSATSAASTSNISYNVADIPEALQLGLLFGVDHLQLQRDVNTLRKICTEKVRWAGLHEDERKLFPCPNTEWYSFLIPSFFFA